MDHVDIVGVSTDPDSYRLTVTLVGGRTVEFDVEPMLWGPVFAPLKANWALFDAVRVSEHRDTVVWPTGADIAPEVLLGTAAQKSA